MPLHRYAFRSRPGFSLQPKPERLRWVAGEPDSVDELNAPRCAAVLGAGLNLMLPLQTAPAFGGAGNLGECSSFTTGTRT